MPDISKHPIVIRDLIELATALAKDNQSAAERFLIIAEETFKLLDRLPGIGQLIELADPRFADVRQYPMQGFKGYIILYRTTDLGIEILRVLHDNFVRAMSIDESVGR
ncbi:MAG: type II toxin-antitoxin system RelE/ParE family toxin [Gloeobacterales cyanobacterium]